MEINIKRLNDAYHMEATNEDGSTISLDSSPDAGGMNLGFRPMQLLLAGVGGCSAIDIISILKKQKQPLEDIQVKVHADREEGKVPSLFKKIHITYTLKGKLDEHKVKRAVELSMDQYCSVAKILEKTAEISYSFEIKE